jgi:hypothetical protein
MMYFGSDIVLFADFVEPTPIVEEKKKEDQLFKESNQVEKLLNTP